MPAEGRGLTSDTPREVVKGVEIGESLPNSSDSSGDRGTGLVPKRSGCATGASRPPRESPVRVCLGTTSVGEPDAGNPHVRFDERELETESRIGLRHRHTAKAAGNSQAPIPTATAPVLYSTGG